MKLTQSRLSLLRGLANNGGSVLWCNIGGVGKTASHYLVMNGLAERIEAPSSVFQPDLCRLQITAAGRDALGV